MNTRARARKFPNGRTKPRPPCGLFAKLTAPQREQVFTWLAVDGLTYKATLAKIQEKFSITVKHHLLWSFWQRHCTPRLLAQPAAADGGQNPVMLEILIQIRSCNGTAIISTKAT
jgi:hypothetical protein